MTARLFSSLLTGALLLGLVWIAPPLRADTLIDFEGLGLNEGDAVTNQIPGVTISGAIFVQQGSPQFAFGGAGGSDTRTSGAPASGGMITDGDGDITSPANPINLVFDDLVKDITFTVVDIDAGTANAHVFNGVIYDENDVPVTSLTINAGDPGTGDGVGTLIDFTGFSGIQRLEFSVVNQPAGNSGFAADNFQFAAVPEPASLAIWSLLGVIVGVGIWRRRRK